MPIYEFKCENCGEEFELLLSASKRDDAKLKCPKCGKNNVKRMMSKVSRPITDSGSAPTCSSGTCGF
ncbi:zinc ribbon domain-containing protein [bacterium]|nr:zinc ribbon domain-containing protein [bacterium]